MTVHASTIDFVISNRRRRASRYAATLAIMLALVMAIFAITLSIGQSITPPADVLRVLMGETVPGASFTVGQLRLPRAVMSVLAGFCFGLGGVAFQIMLRNPLASPDIIGITSGAGAAAVFAIVILSMSGPMVSIIAIVAGLGVALAVYGLSFRNGVAGTRLILVGIGVSAMLQSIIAYILQSAPAWSLQEAMRWLTGSVNGAQLDQALPLLTALVVFGGLLVSRSRDLEALRLGDDMAAALGTKVAQTRMLVMIAAVGLIASATAVTGPIAFVSFLAGPIAGRIVRNDGSLLLPSALTGALLVLVADYVGQHFLPGRYPVGVVTGALGAPYLIYLIIRVNRIGGSL
ncbi:MULTISPECIES: FecCD family ABC transporter permease [unclassified Rhizobium]|uniref:FecCD family ABC transporter permease n=1 Tax=unclassified Rhizobium TaxID=2613769 RepID=UPI0007122F98|nr:MULTISPECIES: iron chelate uptake ABC transporter family permease subunit [unclassified Rhizobium]KQS88178.1 ABC transporter permease [Rhizobium sp. Leaf391]KQT00675.1 ABC transporter permease [Rhizobium sp. Leaf386]KQU09148.1 ABC transporter permease [Rhizobium sp. Leaf453]